MRKIQFYLLLMLTIILVIPQEDAKNSIESLLNNKADQITKEEIAKRSEIIPAPAISPRIVQKVKKAEAFTATTLHYQILFLINASFIAAMVVVIRRRKLQLEQLKVSDLKNNIKKLRAEQLGSLSDSKLKKIRTGLFKKNIIIDNNGLNITSLAKKLSISKGEVHLAAKLNLLYEQNK